VRLAKQNCFLTLREARLIWAMVGGGDRRRKLARDFRGSTWITACSIARKMLDLVEDRPVVRRGV